MGMVGVVVSLILSFVEEVKGFIASSKERI